MTSVPATFAFGMPGGGEILLLLLILLLLFGTKNLPGMARTLGRTLEEFRRAARDVSDEIMHADDKPEPPRKSLPGSVPQEPPESPADKTDDPAPKDDPA